MNIFNKEYITTQLKRHSIEQCRDIYTRLEPIFKTIHEDVTDNSAGMVKLVRLFGDLRRHRPLLFSFINHIYYKITNIEIDIHINVWTQYNGQLAETYVPVQRGCIVCSILIAMLQVLQKESEVVVECANRFLDRASKYYMMGTSCWEILNPLFLYLANEIVTKMNSILIDINKNDDQRTQQITGVVNAPSRRMSNSALNVPISNSSRFDPKNINEIEKRLNDYTVTANVLIKATQDKLVDAYDKGVKKGLETLDRLIEGEQKKIETLEKIGKLQNDIHSWVQADLKKEKGKPTSYTKGIIKKLKQLVVKKPQPQHGGVIKKKLSTKKKTVRRRLP